ncbi:hypothetical protein B9Z55_021591 [Caenorhabditis nigoni]|uniref:F-box domain-containing protein n=1 Tax=Caenorhabditis nigoni TaxID=1611254 RepID=A0A2G5TST6_9PELO|nr:hypothetical protein B9Z55_021591 [Caenorhabditis nigoni]
MSIDPLSVLHSLFHCVSDSLPRAFSGRGFLGAHLPVPAKSPSSIPSFISQSTNLMPIPILSLPGKNLQYALNCLSVGDLIAFSLCSKRTKHLAKSSNRKIESICADFDTCSSIIIQHLDEELFFDFGDSWADLERGNGIEIWRKREFAHSDWIPHLLHIFNDPVIRVLSIKDVSLAYLDTIKRIIPRCNRLEISENCSDDVAKMAFLKLSPIAVKEVEVYKNIFDKENDVSKALTLNLESVIFCDYKNPLELNSDDLLMNNIANLIIHKVNITGKELNRFLKLWMKGNHSFYRPKNIELVLEKATKREEVLRGVKYQVVDYKHQLKRADGKVLLISIGWRCVVFQFQ